MLILSDEVHCHFIYIYVFLEIQIFRNHQYELN